MVDSQTTRVGISDNVDEGVAGELIRGVSGPAHGLVMPNLNTVDFGDYDVLLVINPDLEDAKIEELVRALEGGLTAFIWFSATNGIKERPLRVCRRLGYDLLTSRPSDKYRVEYTVDYPVASKRGHSSEMELSKKRSLVVFKPLATNFPRVRKTIVNRPSLIGKEILSVQVELGDGLAIMTDSTGRADMRLDMFSHVFTNSKRHSSYRAAGWAEQAKVALPAVVASLFEVYDEIPFGLLAERAGLDLEKIDGRMLMEVLEALIREHRISGKIRKDGLVKQ